MVLWPKISLGIVIAMIFLIISPSESSGKLPPVINITVNNASIDVEVREIALGEVLRAIAAKTGILLKLGDPLTEAVTHSIKALPLEEALKLLLANRNYSLMFKKTEDGNFVPTEIRTVENSPSDGSNRAGNSASISALPPNEFGLPAIVDNHMKMLTKEQLGQQLGNTEVLLKQMAAVPVADGPFIKGIRLTRLADQSALAGIGLAQGDLISNVNGMRVESALQFLQAVKSPPTGVSSIMIGITRNGRYESRYLRLQ